MSSLRGATKKFVDEAFAMETDDCILWPFSLHPKGYPNAQDANGVYKPHRRICERQHGPAPTPRHHAAHSCDIKRCINKRHLRWATPKENEADKTERGIRYGARRLANWQAIEAVELVDQGAPYDVVGKRYGVTGRAIKKIASGKTYRELFARK